MTSKQQTCKHFPWYGNWSKLLGAGSTESTSTQCLTYSTKNVYLCRINVHYNTPSEWISSCILRWRIFCTTELLSQSYSPFLYRNWRPMNEPMRRDRGVERNLHRCKRYEFGEPRQEARTKDKIIGKTQRKTIYGKEEIIYFTCDRVNTHWEREGEWAEGFAHALQFLVIRI